MTTNTDPVRAQDYVAVPRAFLEQVYAMAREGCEAPATAYRWCERIDGLFHGGSLDEHDEWARQLPAALASAPPSAPVGEVCIRLNGIGEGGPYPVVNGVCVLPQSVAENLVASTVGQQMKRELLAQWASYKQPAAPSGEAVAWLRMTPDGTPDWAEDCIGSDDKFLDPEMASDGYYLQPLYAAPQQPAGVEVDDDGH